MLSSVFFLIVKKTSHWRLIIILFFLIENLLNPLEIKFYTYLHALGETGHQFFISS